MEIIVRDNPVCPVCHSDVVRAFKVHMGTGHGWSSQCVSGLDHGIAVMPDGREVSFPKDPWFDDDGRVEIPGIGMVSVLRQEGIPT